MECPWLIIGRSRLRDHRAQIVAKDRELAQQSNELHEVRNGLRQQDAKHSREVFLLSEQAKQATALAAEKQRELASLRAQMQEQKADFKEQLAGFTDERKKLVDWITKGMSGMPVFAELKAEPELVEPEKPAVTGQEVPETDLAEAVRRAGRNPRSIVKFMDKKSDSEFAEAMQNGGVRKLFDEDRALGEAEALVAKTQ